MTSAPASRRIHSVDALRGFAVMAILLIHNIEHFIFSVYPTDGPEWLRDVNQAVFDTVFFLFAGKAYAIFALLFGFTYYIQLHNRQSVGRDFSGRFMWRLLLLAGFACVNAAFFPAGDVLLLFAVVGGVLVVVRNWQDKSVLILAVFFLIQPYEWFCFLATLFCHGFTSPDLHIGEMYAKVGTVTRSGNFWDFIVCNLGLGQKASLLWAVGAGRFMQTAGLFLLGFLIGRRQLFINSRRSVDFWRRILICSMILFVPLYFLHGSIATRSDSFYTPLATILDMWHKLAFTFVLIAGFMLLFETTKFRSHTAALQLYGKMSLTNYLSQSVIGAMIYFPFGLYLAPKCGYAASLLIGVVVFIFQVAFSKWWLGRHRQGPLESIWHKLTWI